MYADANCQALVPDLTALILDATDSCANDVIITQSILANSTITSDIIVEITVADSLGNSSDCDVLLVVLDTTSPIAICKPLTLQLDMTGFAHFSPEDLDNASTDNCGILSLELDTTSFDCLALGANPVTLTVTDNSGNFSTCEDTVYIIDNVDPILDCPAPVTLGADVNCEAPTPNFADALSNNNCGSATITQFPVADSMLTVGLTIVTVVATDDSGNTDTCTVDVTVIDTTPPEYTCATPILDSVDLGECFAIIDLTPPVAYDNCDSTSFTMEYRVYSPDNSISDFIDTTVTTSYQFMVGISQVEWIMTDNAGNESECLQEVEIIEDELPVIICPDSSVYTFDNTIVVCGYIIPNDTLDATATDNCKLVSLTHNFGVWGNPNSLVGATFPVGTTEVMWIAEDETGNTDTCTTTIIVEDVQNPEFVNCPNGDTLTIALFSAVCEGSAIWSIPIASDNCDGVEVVQTGGPERGSPLAAGFYEIEYTATDTSDNFTICTFTLEVIDTEDPIVAPDFHKDNDEGVCSWTAPAGTISPLLAISNCPFEVTFEITGATIGSGIDDASGTEFNLGTSVVEYTITDTVNWQSWTCDFSVFVYDTEAPVVTCPDPIEEINDLGLCSNIIDLTLPDFTENCNDSTVTISYRVFEPDNSLKGPFSSADTLFEFEIGVSQVEWFVADEAGNVSSCMQEVTIFETEDPVITCPAEDNFVFNTSNGLCGYRIPDNRLDATATDNCGEYELSHDFGDWAILNSLEGAVFPTGTTEVTWTAIDESGNSVSCSINVTVIDNEDPYFVNCPHGVTFTVGLFSGVCEGGAIWSVPVAMDNCSDVTITQTRGPSQGAVLTEGVYDIQYRATDRAGNNDYCSFTVEVKDTEEPLIACQPDLVYENDLGECSWTSIESSLSPLLANSNCPATVSWKVTNPDGTVVSGVDDVSGYTFELGTSTVQYDIVEDASEQGDSCSFTVTIIDTEAPEIICQPTLQVTALPGDCSAEIILISPEFMDNCSYEEGDISYRVFGADNSTSVLFPATDSVYEFMVGINRIEWLVTDEAGNLSFCWQDVWVVADEESLIPEAGENKIICESDTLEISNAFAPDFAMVEWSTSGTGQFIDPSVINSSYVPSPADILDGFVILTITSSTDCASASDQLILSITNPPLVSSGNDATICESEIYQLYGAIINSAVAVEWITTGTGEFSNANVFNPVYTPGTNDIEQGVVQLIFKGISGGPCDDVSDTMNLTIHRQPIISAGTDEVICETESITLSNASIVYGEAVNWTTSGSGVFDDETFINTTYNFSEADLLNGSVVLTLTQIPDGPCEVTSSSITIDISKHPVVDAGPDIQTCFNQLVTINGASAINFSKVNWTSNGSGTLESATSLTPIYVPAAEETGTIELTMQVIGENGCTIDTMYDKVEIEIYPELIVDAGEDQTIYYNSTSMLSVSVENGSGTYFYNWYPTGFVSDPSANYTETIDLTRTMEFEVVVTDAKTNCVASDTKTIYVDEVAGNLVGFYTGFSPNNDGVNDTWSIKGIEKFPQNEVMFFNRWGDKVNEYVNYNTGVCTCHILLINLYSAGSCTTPCSINL